MDVFVIGVTGAVGGLLADRLLELGDTVHGLVRREEQRAELEGRGIRARIGDVAAMAADELAGVIGDVDAIVYSAGSNGGKPEVTRSVDGDGVAKAVDAAGIAGVEKFALVSVLPESWRERELGDDVELYFRVKKEADVVVSRSDLQWLILRPSLLVDDPGTGTVSLGPAEMHDQITREDVAATLAALLHEPEIGRQVLELNTGTTPIDEAVRANVRRS